MQRKVDYWQWPAILLLWVSFGWVFWQTASALLERKEIVFRLNQASGISGHNDYRAMEIITEVKRRELALAEDRGEAVLQLLGIPRPSFNRQYGLIYDNVAYMYYDRNEEKLAVRAWSQALVNNPDLEFDAWQVAAVCMFLQNWELGYFAARKSDNQRLIRYFASQHRPSGN